MPKVYLNKVVLIFNTIFKVAILDGVVAPEKEVVSIDEIIYASMFFGNVYALQALLSLGCLLVGIILGIFVVVDCGEVLISALHVHLDSVSIKSLSILIVFQIGFLVDSDAYVHFVIDDEGNVNILDLVK